MRKTKLKILKRRVNYHHSVKEILKRIRVNWAWSGGNIALGDDPIEVANNIEAHIMAKQKG